MNNAVHYLTFKIVLPSDTLADFPATMVTLPGQEGILSILPGHMQLVAHLKAGIAEIHGQNHLHQFFIYDGIAAIDHHSVSIVTEFALKLGDDARNLLSSQIETLREALSTKQNVLEQQTIQYKMRQYQTALQFAKEK